MNVGTRSKVVRGGSSLRGEIVLGGAKNVALAVLPAALLTNEPVTLRNLPVELHDVQTALAGMRSIGCDVQVHGDVVQIRAERLSPHVQLEGQRSIRTSTLFLPALLARTGAASVPEPGGDVIGKRSYDLHVHALEMLGAEVYPGADGRIEASSPAGLRGGPISFRIRTTGGTETALLAAVTAQGTTEINNAHTRPEVVDLIGLLRAMGAMLEVPCAGLIRVEGVSRLHGADYTIIRDPVEAFTYLVAAAMTHGDVTVLDSDFRAMEVPLVFLRETGVEIDVDDMRIRARGPEVLGPVDLAASPYPGIGTDFQPLFGALALLGQGRSRIMDLEFPDRFQYAAELALNGADIDLQPGLAIVHGPTGIRRGAVLRAPDIRGGAALVLSGLVSPSQVRIENWTEIERGYERLDDRLRELGADIA